MNTTKSLTNRTLSGGPSLALLCMLGLLVGFGPSALLSSASAEAIFGFEINSSSPQRLFRFRNQGTDSPTDDTLKTVDPATVTLSVDLGFFQGTFPGATFSFDGLVTSANTGTILGTTVHELLFDGSFAFKDAGAVDILSAAFTGARMLVLENMGIVAFTSGFGATDMVAYTAGPALPAGTTFSGDQEFGFTSTEMKDLLGGPVGISLVPGPAVQFEDFTFKSSYSGSSEIVEVPEPSTSMLAALGILALVWYAASRRNEESDWEVSGI